jgi:nucleotide-binding universal stress UspA family protein
MRPLEKIVAGFDRSERGHDALALGELIARTVGAELLAVRVREAPEDEPAAEGGLDAEVSACIAGSSTPLTTRLLAQGPAAAALRDLAASDRSIGLLAVGSTHRGAIGRVLPGGTAERLLHESPCAVGVAPRGYAHEACADPASPGIVSERLRVIAVGYDATPESRAALEIARVIALAASATLRLIAVGPVYASGWPATDPAADRGVDTPSHPSPRDLQQLLHEAARGLPEELRALPIYERGEPPARLIARAEEGVDLLVMGSRGHGPLQTAILGSTSTIVIGSAPCPTIVVPRPALAQS